MKQKSVLSRDNLGNQIPRSKLPGSAQLNFFLIDIENNINIKNYKKKIAFYIKFIVKIFFICF